MNRFWNSAHCVYMRAHTDIPLQRTAKRRPAQIIKGFPSSSRAGPAGRTGASRGRPDSQNAPHLRAVAPHRSPSPHDRHDRQIRSDRQRPHDHDLAERSPATAAQCVGIRLPAGRSSRKDRSVRSDRINTGTEEPGHTNPMRSQERGPRPAPTPPVPSLARPVGMRTSVALVVYFLPAAFGRLAERTGWSRGYCAWQRLRNEPTASCKDCDDDELLTRLAKCRAFADHEGAGSVTNSGTDGKDA